MKTPFYNQFKIYWQKVCAHGTDVSIDKLYVQAFEKYITTLLEEAKTGVIDGACGFCGADLSPGHQLKK